MQRCLTVLLAAVWAIKRGTQCTSRPNGFDADTASALHNNTPQTAPGLLPPSAPGISPQTHPRDLTTTTSHRRKKARTLPHIKRRSRRRAESRVERPAEAARPVNYAHSLYDNQRVFNCPRIPQGPDFPGQSIPQFDRLSPKGLTCQAKNDKTWRRQHCSACSSSSSKGSAPIS